jgi:catechol-2,3-dioxygenase
VIAAIAELTLRARDLEGMEAFYTTAFNLNVLSRETDRIWLQVGDRARLGIWTPGTKEFGDQGGAHVHFALAAPPGSLDRIVELLRRGSIEVDGPHDHEGGDRSIYVTDPEGNVVEVWDFFHRGPPDERTVRALVGDDAELGDQTPSRGSRNDQAPE